MQLLAEVTGWEGVAALTTAILAGLTGVIYAIWRGIQAIVEAKSKAERERQQAAFEQQEMRDRAARQKRMLDEHEILESDLNGEVMELALENQKLLQSTVDAGAHYAIVFRTHNGDGIPKPTTPIKSTATLEAHKPSVRAMKDDWAAEPVDVALLEVLQTAIARQGEAVLVQQEKLPDGPLKDRYEHWKTPYALLTYVDAVDHYPTFFVAFYSSPEKALKGSHRTLVVGVANRMRAGERSIAMKRARITALDSELTKSFERERSEV
jgi:hypothetical protein